ncbi:CapA family protein [Ferviditalea candida]|uniref:CapA family protein n=1 Tax=Ferviditalea candida TaxID=3108399 RepID=A0ABU5ZDD2_9BACL|nr:CapA family protein [Paenibacillaceae bacterium T2]
MTVPLLIVIVLITALSIWATQYMQDQNLQGQAVPSPHASAGTGSGQQAATPASFPDKAGKLPSTDKQTSSSEDVQPAGGEVSPRNGQVSLALVGDVLLGSKVGNLLKQNGYDYPYEFVRPYLQKPDLTVANLETPVTAGGAPQEKEYVYRTSPQALPALAEAGFDLVNLANNHVLDYGQQGLLDTFDHLDAAQIGFFGAGRDAGEAFAAKYVEVNGVKLAFLGFSNVVPDGSWKAGSGHPGVADSYDYRKPVAAIQEAKKRADLVIVFNHWGKDRTYQPEKYQAELAHRFVDAGADLVVGSHPHVLQGFEQYGGKWIVYSLGNFIFTTNNHPETWETMILQADCRQNGECRLKAVPVLTKWAKPELMSGEKADKLLEHLRNISPNAEVLADGTVTVKGGNGDNSKQ